MIGFSNASSGNSDSFYKNYVNVAKLIITSLIDCSVVAQCTSFTKTFNLNEGYLLDDNYIQYILYINPKQFGTWTVSATCLGVTQTKTLLINKTITYTTMLRARVPDEYQELEYIITDSDTPRIDVLDSEITSYDSTKSYKTNFEFYLTSQDTNTRVLWMYYDGTNRWGFTNSTNSSYYLRYYLGGAVSDDYFTMSPYCATNNKYTLSTTISNGTWTVLCNNIEFGTGTTTRLVYNEKITLFGNSNLDTQFYSSGRIYKFSFLIDNVYKNDLYPCQRKSDDAVGLYDRINNNFLTATGGTFAAGPNFNEVVPLYLYYYGNEFIPITGGFKGAHVDSRYTTGFPINDKLSNKLFIPNENNGSKSAVTRNKIDITNYSTLEVQGYTGSSPGDTIHIGLSTTGLPDNNGVHVADAGLAASSWSTVESRPTSLSLDISNLFGSYYIYCQGATGGGFYMQQFKLY